MKNKKLALFFTAGVSLKIWQQTGSLDREIKPYIHLAKYFKQIYFLSYGNKSELKYQNLLPTNITILPNKWPIPSKIYSFLLPFLYRRELKETDFYKTNQMSGSWSAVIAKWFYKKKLIVRCGYELLSFLTNQKRSTLKRKIIYLAEKIAYQNADQIILTSNKDKRFIKEKFKASDQKIKIIPNYIDTGLFKPLNTSKEKNRLIFVGRLKKQKNLFNLIKAISGLEMPHSELCSTTGDIKLVIFGSGPLKNKLEVFAQEKKAQVEFKGNIPNQQLPIELNKSEIFILPSFYEGCPKTLLEAMACGLPCIGTNVQGIKEIIKHQENGHLCQTDVQSIKKAIITLLQNKDLKKKIGINARQTILDNFSLEKILKKEIEVYETF